MAQEQLAIRERLVAQDLPVRLERPGQQARQVLLLFRVIQVLPVRLELPV